MMSCWSLQPNNRPKFHNLVTQFSDLLEMESGYLELSRSLSWKKKPHDQPSSEAFVLTDIMEKDDEAKADVQLNQNSIQLTQ